MESKKRKKNSYFKSVCRNCTVWLIYELYARRGWWRWSRHFHAIERNKEGEKSVREKKTQKKTSLYCT